MRFNLFPLGPFQGYLKQHVNAFLAHDVCFFIIAKAIKSMSSGYPALKASV